jgi:hypothetical protein
VVVRVRAVDPRGLGGGFLGRVLPLEFVRCAEESTDGSGLPVAQVVVFDDVDSVGS